MQARYIETQRWSVLFYFDFDIRDQERILDALVWAEAPDSITEKVSEAISAGDFNEGFCFSNPSLRVSIVGIGKTDTGPEFLNTVIHEIAHLALHIAEEDGIDPYSEDLAYLMGDISHEISDIICEMSCPHCREEI